MNLEKAHRFDRLLAFFKALADPTRLRILNLLSEREVCVCSLCEVLGLVQPMVSRHLAYLRRAGLVTARRDGQWMHYAWAPQAEPVTRNLMDGLRDWMAKDSTMRREFRTLKQARCK